MSLSVQKIDRYCYEVFVDDVGAGIVRVDKNLFHDQNAYLKLELHEFKPELAHDLFAWFRTELGRPLQVMLSSQEEKVTKLLRSGGFELRRRCYEVEGGIPDLKESINEAMPLQEAEPGDKAYDLCCNLLYRYYQKTHEAISPLIVSEQKFCVGLPRHVLYQENESSVYHAAFVEGNEIAYLCTERVDDFSQFGCSLLKSMLRESDTVFFESDDCDPVAMMLRRMFQNPGEESFDTYIFA